MKIAITVSSVMCRAQSAQVLSGGSSQGGHSGQQQGPTAQPPAAWQARQGAAPRRCLAAGPWRSPHQLMRFSCSAWHTADTSRSADWRGTLRGRRVDGVMFSASGSPSSSLLSSSPSLSSSWSPSEEEEDEGGSTTGLRALRAARSGMRREAVGGTRAGVRSCRASGQRGDVSGLVSEAGGGGGPAALLLNMLRLAQAGGLTVGHAQQHVSCPLMAVPSPYLSLFIIVRI